MTDIQQKCLEKADHTLKGARVLFSEGFYDDSASSCYYAMFYAVTAMMLEKGRKFKKHASIIGAFHEDWVRTGLVEQEYQRYLNHAFDMRNKADYDLGQSNNKEAAELQIVRAEAFVKMGREKLE